MIHRKPYRKEMTADDIRKVLMRKFKRPRHIVTQEVCNTTGGFFGCRTADMIVIEMYPSDGCKIHGIEIKVSKGDLKAELKDLSKSGAIKNYCDMWWLAIPPDLLPTTVAIPDDWGIMVCKSRVTVERRAKRLQPKPVDRYFLASLIRCLERSFAASVYEFTQSFCR